MPKTVEIELFQYAELSEKAKEKARNWWLECRDSSDYEATLDSSAEVLEWLGIDFAQQKVELYGGGIRYDRRIYWSGFSCQGDGASFEGTYHYAKGALAKIEKEIGEENDREIMRIARELQALQAKNFYGISAKITAGGHYSHSGNIQIEALNRHGTDIECPELLRLMRDAADWLYAKLEAEEDYQTSEETIAEVMEGNEYTFRADGRRENG